MKGLVDQSVGYLESEDFGDADKKLELFSLASQVVQPLAIIADLEIGRNGFHRADVVNMTWDELSPTFSGMRDQPLQAKRRCVMRVV